MYLTEISKSPDPVSLRARRSLPGVAISHLPGKAGLLEIASLARRNEVSQLTRNDTDIFRMSSKEKTCLAAGPYS
jgi:hypothetical protein